MTCSWCKTDEHVVVTKGWGRLLGGLARSPFGIMLEIPAEIAIPVCTQCSHRIVDEELEAKLVEFERGEIAAEKARRGLPSDAHVAETRLERGHNKLKHLEKSDLEAERASQLRSLAEIEALWLDGAINRGETISFIVAWVRREVDPGWLKGEGPSGRA